MAAITWQWRMIPLYHRNWSWIPGGLLIVSGLVVYGFARQGFSLHQLLGHSELEPHRYEQTLQTAGIRARLRHPYYLGHLCELAGWCIGSGLVVVYGMALFAALTGYFMVRAEERELEMRLGDKYRNYRQRTAAMFPGIW
jgi:protein-S-isoprenylcysteine O-methyltransferase Ste14